MATEDDNVAILRDAYRRWSDQKGQDLNAMMDIVADDVSLRSLADGAPDVGFTKRRSGKAEVLGYLQGLTSGWEMLSFDVDEYVAQGDRVVAIGRTAWRNKKTGKVADTPKIDLWRFRNGKAVEFAEFYDTANVLAAAQP
jgi:uncharacterized protein